MVWEAFKSGDSGYVAIGISRDNKMGDDLVMACQDVSICAHIHYIPDYQFILGRHISMYGNLVPSTLEGTVARDFRPTVFF